MIPSALEWQDALRGLSGPYPPLVEPEPEWCSIANDLAAALLLFVEQSPEHGMTTRLRDQRTTHGVDIVGLSHFALNRWRKAHDDVG